MAQITLVRHGQANSGSQDELGYDKLSDLGHQQAAWLGEHLETTGQVFDSVYCGTLRRHIETAHGMNAQTHAPLIKDARLNELSYFDMAKLYEQQHGVPIPNDREGFTRHLPALFTAWQNDELENPPETFVQFETRVRNALSDIAARSDRALVVTSGGLIGMVMRQSMDLDIPGYARMCLAIMNSSTHRLIRMGDHLAVTQFNNVSHLEHTGRHHAQTYI